MASSDAPYSLSYFEDIFGGRTAEFHELLGILIEMLKAYQALYPSVARSGDSEELHRFRHKHVTLVENLELTRLKELSQAIGGLTESTARESNIREVLDEVVRLIAALRAEIPAS